jgi:hypothetical protein
MVTLQGSAVPRPVTAAPVDALARQLAADDLVGSELVPGRVVRRVTLDDDGHAFDGATRRRQWRARHLGLVPFVAWLALLLGWARRSWLRGVAHWRPHYPSRCARLDAGRP